jgi:predicted PurR-regulated permease PerM
MKGLKINWLFWLQALIFIGVVFVIFNIIANYGAIFAGIGNFLRIISPVIVGFVIAYLLSGACNFFERIIEKNAKKPFVKKRARGFSVMIVYLLAVLLLYLTGLFLLPLIISNITEFILSLPELYREARIWILSFDWGGMSEVFDIEGQLQSFFDNFTIFDVMDHVQIGVYTVTGFVANMTSGVFNAVIATIISIYASLHKKKVLDMFNRVMNIFVKEPRLSKTRAHLYLANDLFYKFIKAQFLDACILGFLATILLSVLGVPFALILGLFLGVCNMIPQFGSIFGTIVTIMFTLITGTPTQALMVAIFLTILQQIDANVISPKIMGTALKINPILILSSLIIGGAYFGVIGMFLSIPIMAMLKILFIDTLEKEEIRKNMDNGNGYNGSYDDEFEDSINDEELEQEKVGDSVNEELEEEDSTPNTFED